MAMAMWLQSNEGYAPITGGVKSTKHTVANPETSPDRPLHTGLDGHWTDKHGRGSYMMHSFVWESTNLRN